MQHIVKLPLFTVHTQRSPYIFHRGIHSVHVVIWRRAKPCARNLNSTKCIELKQIHKSCQGEWGCVRLERTWERFRRQRHYLCADRQVVLVTSTTCYTAVRYHQFTPTSTSTPAIIKTNANANLNYGGESPLVMEEVDRSRQKQNHSMSQTSPSY